MANRIESPENPRIRAVARFLKDRAYRREQGKAVLENPVMLREALSAGVKVEDVFFSETSAKEDGNLVALCETHGIPIFSVSDRVMKKLSALETPQGVSAVIDLASLPKMTLYPEGRYVVCERMSDPGNLGTVIRTADAMGFDGVILSKGSVDVFSPKVIRATMGSFFRVPVMTEADLPAILGKCKEKGILSVAAVLDDKAKPAQTVAPVKGIAVLIGNEATGLSRETVSLCDQTAYIPMTGRTESLNAAVAAAIFMWIFRKDI